MVNPRATPTASAARRTAPLEPIDSMYRSSGAPSPLGETPWGTRSTPSLSPAATSIRTPGSSDPTSPVTTRWSPQRRLISAQNRSAMGTASLVVQATLVPGRSLKCPSLVSNRTGGGMTG